MIKPFEGLQPATDYAEAETKIKANELCISIANVGGLVYEVSPQFEVRKEAKIIHVYKNGIKVK